MAQNGNKPKKSSKLWLAGIAVWAVAAALIASATPWISDIEAQPSKAKDEGNSVTSEIQTVLDFVEGWNRKDVDAIMEFFAEDAVYHNIPVEPTIGKKAIRASIESIVSMSETIEWEMVNIAQTGSTVLTERVDSMSINGTMVDMPVMGAFEVKGGKITAFRDYFDMGMWQRQTKDLL